MPIGCFDIKDREPVFALEEIEAGRLQCEATGLQYIQPTAAHRAVPLALYVERLTKRWHRAVQTGQLMDAIRAGYCTIESKGAPEPSRATH